jgi:cytosine/adenosine deaminase-related metal-dependent hydrolase
MPNSRPGGFFAEAADSVDDVEAAMARRAMYRRRVSFSSASVVHPEAGEFIIRNICLLTRDPHIGNLTDADIHVRDGLIVDIGHDLEARVLFEIDGRAAIALPGLVAGHRHICTEALLPNGCGREGDHAASLCGADASDIYKVLRVALLDAVSVGTTTVHHCASDIGGAHAETAILAQIDSGLRGRFSYPLDRPLSREPLNDLHALRRIERHWFASASEHLLDLGIAVTGAGENLQEIADTDRTALPISRHDSIRSSDKDGLVAETLEAARALSLDHCIGSLTPGKRADLILLNAGHENIPPEQAEAVAQHVKASDVLLVAIDGRLRKRNGVLTDPNEGVIRREGADAIARLRAMVSW